MRGNLRLDAMPSHHIALQQVLAGIEKQIAVDEARLVRSTTDGEREKLIEEIVDLKVRQAEVRGMLLDEDR